MSPDMSSQRESTCKGRFTQLRSELEEALMYFGHTITVGDIVDVYNYIQPRMFQHDQPDNYFHSGQDQLRPSPKPLPASIVPFLAKRISLPADSITAYIASLEATAEVVPHLEAYNDRKELAEFADKKTKLLTNFGIGNRASDAIVSDAPFSIELWVPVNRHEEHAGTLSFWYRSFGNKNIMLIDQIQAARTSIPVENIEQTLLSAAERVAPAQGFQEIWVYPAAKHPVFIASPDRRARLGQEFFKFYDQNAEQHGFSGDPATYYAKEVR